MTDQYSDNKSTSMVYDGKINQSNYIKYKGMIYNKNDVIGGKYEVCDIAGKGGFGVVYRTYSREVEHILALKTIKNEYLNDKSVRERFLKEAYIWIGLDSHPFIVTAYLIDMISDYIFLGLEYIPPNRNGENCINDCFNGNAPSIAQILRWSIQFCFGMEYAYEHGIKCHRDIKPSNILISPENNIKITDFGLSGELDEGITVGTPQYMPPEQFLNSKDCDERSDLYSFGVVLYQMATGGRFPFNPQKSKNMWSAFYEMHRDCPMIKIESPLQDIIYKCLEKEIANRYQSFAELRDDLERLLESYNGETVEVPQRGQIEPWEYNNKANSLNNLGLYKEAIPLLNKAIELDSEYAHAWNNKGCALLGLKNYPEAIECFNISIRIDRGYADVWYNLGTAYGDYGAETSRPDLFEQSIPCYKKAIELNRKIYKAWFNKAVAEMTIGDYPNALKDYEYFLQIAPEEYYDEISDANEQIRILRKKLKR